MKKIKPKKKLTTIVPLSEIRKGSKIDNDHKVLYKELYKLNESQKSELEDAKFDIIKLEAQVSSVTSDYIYASSKLKIIESQDYEHKFKNLQRNLVNCLSRDELEASNIAGCDPDVYVIELLKIFQEWKNHNKKPEDFGKNNTYRGY